MPAPREKAKAIRGKSTSTTRPPVRELVSSGAAFYKIMSRWGPGGPLGKCGIARTGLPQFYISPLPCYSERRSLLGFIDC